jgi:hypothetical protein
MWSSCNAGLAGQPAQNVFKLGEPVEYSPAESALGKIKWDGHSQEVHPRSRACQYVNPYLTMGATISTGISQILTNTGEKQVTYCDCTQHHVSVLVQSQPLKYAFPARQCSRALGR